MTAAVFGALAVVLGAALSAVMAGAFMVQQRTGNSGWVDTIWTFGLGAIGVASALWPLGFGGSPDGRQWLVAAMIAAWALRLGLHIAHRTRGISDDPRYAELIRGWGEDAPRQMFVLLQKQALVSIPLAVTLMLAANAPAPLWQPLDVLAVVVFAAGWVGEMTADAQLRAFSKDGPGGVCDTGLWAWSRHPNYFCEWLMWVAFALLALNSGWGLLALAGPAAIYWLLTSVSGIPPLEQHMRRTRGDPYRRYQARTNAFFPWPPADVVHGQDTRA